jgi:hypothetical protein
VICCGSGRRGGYPRKKKYRRFLDQLLPIYYQAKRDAADQRLSSAGRQQRVALLEERPCQLCRPQWREAGPGSSPHERDFANLVSELVQQMLDEELFTLVLEEGVEAANNLTERLQHSPALDRKAGRTSKTAAGAHRRSVIVSVLESLRANLDSFTLSSVVAEARRWMENGRSLFVQHWHAVIAQLSPPLASKSS